MPYRSWSHECAESDRLERLSRPRCDRCGEAGDLEENVIVSGASDMHPAYFETRFRVHTPIEWPDDFVIISAYAPTGQDWSDERNEQAHAELRGALRECGTWMRDILGFSPETGHAEPSYAAELPLHAACALGLRFQQDAIFHVRGDALSVTHCDERRGLVRVGAFRELVES